MPLLTCFAISAIACAAVATGTHAANCCPAALPIHIKAKTTYVDRAGRCPGRQGGMLAEVGAMQGVDQPRRSRLQTGKLRPDKYSSFPSQTQVS